MVANSLQMSMLKFHSVLLHVCKVPSEREGAPQIQSHIKE